MPLYEHTFLARQDLSSAQVEALVEQTRELVEGAGGSLGRIESWGVKSLQYRIDKNRKAHFTLVDLDAPADTIKELERQWRISEDVLRYLTVKVEKFEDGPSAMLQRRDDRRGGRGDRDRDRGPRGDRPPRRDDDRPPRRDDDRPPRRDDDRPPRRDDRPRETSHEGAAQGA